MLLGRRLKCPKCGQSFQAARTSDPAIPVAQGFAPPPARSDAAIAAGIAPPAQTDALVAAGAPLDSPLPMLQEIAASPAAAPRRILPILVLVAGLVVVGAGAVVAYSLSDHSAPAEQVQVSPAPDDAGLDQLPPGETPGKVGENKDEKPADPPTIKNIEPPPAPPPDPKDRPRPDNPDKPGTDPNPPPLDKGPALPPGVLSKENQQKVNAAIDRGVDFLKTTQLATGSWSGGNPVGYAALPALTLLECGVSPKDQSIQKAAMFVRQQSPNLIGTYEISLAILFLDKLGDKNDKNLIGDLAMRLVAGQQGDGGWTYNCPKLTPKDQHELLTFLYESRPSPYLFTGKNNQPLIPVSKAMVGLDKVTGDKSQVPIGGDKSTTPKDGQGEKPQGDPKSETPNLPGKEDPADPAGEKKKDELLPPPEGDVGKDKGTGDTPPEKTPTKPAPNLPVEGVFKAANPNKLTPLLKNMAVVKLTPGLKALGRTTPFPGIAMSDNSNTQFALIALWVARKYNVPVEKTFALVDQRFMSSQQTDGGWGYMYVKGFSTNSMTCVGLIGLAVGHGSYKESLGVAWKLVKEKQLKDSPAVQRGLAKLGEYIGVAPADWNQMSPKQNLYFLWAVERVAVMYGLQEIGGKDWYSWAAQQLVVNQLADGSWQNGMYHGTSKTLDACFALLILKRANFVPDLTESLQELVPITDGKKK